MEKANVPKRKKPVKRRYQAISEEQDEDTEEQRIERESFYKDRRKRRSRFRHSKKYDLTIEEDIGDSVRTYTQVMLLHPNERSFAKINEEQCNTMKEEEDDTLFLNQEAVKPFFSSYSASDPLQSLLHRAETYLNADEGDTKKGPDVLPDNDPMQFLKSGYSAPKANDLPFKIRDSVALGDTINQLVRVECNDAYRRFILGLEEWPVAKNNLIRLPRFKGDTVGTVVALKQGIAHPSKKAVPPNEKMEYENQNMVFYYEVHPEMPSSKCFNITIKKRYLPIMNKAMYKAGHFPPHQLPRSCYNPIMKRARFPSNLDTFHYFPFSSRYSTQDLFRFNTAQTHYNDLRLSVDQAMTEFFRPMIRKSWTILDRHVDFIHYRYASLLTARILLGSSGSLSPSSRQHGSTLTRLLRILNRETGQWGRSAWIIRASQEMACNRILWTGIETILKHILAKVPTSTSHRLRGDLEAIKNHLLSGESAFSNPFALRSSNHLATASLRLRKELWGFVRFIVRRYRNFSIESSAFTTDSSDHKPESIKAKDILKRVNVEEIIEKIIPQMHMQVPYNVTFSLLFAQKLSSDLDTIQSTAFFELYSQVIHQWKIDFASIQLTVASLLSELSMRRFRFMNALEESHSTNSTLMSLTHDQILTYLDTSSLLFGNCCKTIHKHVLSAPLAMTILLRLSFMGNVGIPVPDKRCKGHAANVRDIAEAIVHYSEKISIFHLPIFSDIHLTTGIAEMCSVMSTEAAEILSQAWSPDNSIYRTPFDLVRLALKKMNNLDQIIRDNVFSLSAECVPVSTIIAAYERASDKFQNCLTYNMHDVIYLSWYLASRAGSLVLASGLIPSKTGEKDDTKVNNSSGYLARTLRRHRHENYTLIRTAVLKTFRSLLKISGTPYTHSLHHLMVSSCLEWGEVMQLIVQKPHGSRNNAFKELRRLHASHTLLWVYQNPTKDNLKRILYLCQVGEVRYEAVLSVMASLVEHKPNETSSWCNLAIALGPYRSKNITSNPVSGWWGEGRQWWDQFFQVDDTILTSDIHKSLSQLLSTDAKYSASTKQLSFSSLLQKKRKGVSTKSSSLYLTSDTWMLVNASDSDDDDDEYSYVSDGDSSDKVISKLDDSDIYLPRDHADVLGDKNSICLMKNLESSPLYQMDSHSRILCAKILICGHLFGRMHPFVSAAVRKLLSNDKVYSSPSDALRWLLDQGFFIHRDISGKSASCVSTKKSIDNSSCLDAYNFLHI